MAKQNRLAHTQDGQRAPNIEDKKAATLSRKFQLDKTESTVLIADLIWNYAQKRRREQIEVLSCVTLWFRESC